VEFSVVVYFILFMYIKKNNFILTNNIFSNKVENIIIFISEKLIKYKDKGGVKKNPCEFSKMYKFSSIS
jgi:hypothetical protein